MKKPYVVWLTETSCLEYRISAKSEAHALKILEEDDFVAHSRKKLLDRTIEIREEKNELETSV